MTWASVLYRNLIIKANTEALRSRSHVQADPRTGYGDYCRCGTRKVGGRCPVCDYREPERERCRG